MILAETNIASVAQNLQGNLQCQFSHDGRNFKSITVEQALADLSHEAEPAWRILGWMKDNEDLTVGIKQGVYRVVRQ